MEENSTSERPAKKRGFRKFLFVFFLLLAAGLTIYYFVCGITYSEGSRSGILTKVSKRGFLFKTYEGELNIGGLNQGDGTIMPATVFYFSARDKAVFKKLDSLQGRKVVVHYRQVLKNLFWQGDTDYFVYEVNPALNR
jgi:hypothetical protein